jgi:hypothetical protein
VATAGMQEKTVAGLLADLGVTGYGGIAATIDGSVNTKLNITVTQPAYVVYTDGTVIADELATTSITGLSTDGTYGLYADYTSGGAQGTAYSATWSVASTAPSAKAVKVATVVVASNVLSTVTMVGSGLSGMKQQFTLAPTTPTFPTTTTWVQNTTGTDVVAYVNTGALTQTHIYVNSTNSSTGAIDLTALAPTTIIIPNSYYISFTYSAGTGAWKWQGLRSR